MQVEPVPDQESMVINQQDFSGSVGQLDSQVQADPPLHDVAIVQDTPAVVVQVPVDNGNIALATQPELHQWNQFLLRVVFRLVFSLLWKWRKCHSVR